MALDILRILYYYNVEKLSTRNIAKKLGHSDVTVCKFLHTSLQMRSKSEAAIIGKQNFPPPKGEDSHMYGKGGPLHPNWKGGNSRVRMAINTSEYKEWRTKVFERDNYTCQDCGVRSIKGIKVYLNAHHIKTWKNYSNLRYTLSNGVTLCIKCHNKPGKHKYNIKKGTKTPFGG